MAHPRGRLAHRETSRVGKRGSPAWFLIMGPCGHRQESSRACHLAVRISRGRLGAWGQPGAELPRHGQAQPFPGTGIPVGPGTGPRSQRPRRKLRVSRPRRETQTLHRVPGRTSQKETRETDGGPGLGGLGLRVTGPCGGVRMHPDSVRACLNAGRAVSRWGQWGARGALDKAGPSTWGSRTVGHAQVFDLEGAF